VTERLCSVRDRVAPRIRLAVLSNSTTAAWPDVRRGLNRFDDRYMKLDAGDPITCAYLNGPATSIRAIIDALCGLPRIVVQAMFVTDTANQVDNTREGAVSEWLAALERIRPMQVHIYTLDRAPALSSLHPVPSCRLREIAEQVHAAGIPAEVFPARACERSRQST
jgi:wyosine [tRNA(Phe)-imidazoG37] synthetase (radical SAM superfamily)